MAKPIRLTDELRELAVTEFASALSKIKMAEGKLNYCKNFTYKDEEKAKILFTPTAYAKMISLLMAFDSEVAWHGGGSRIDASTYLISDIFVYPQTVTGTTVEMDNEKYAKWIEDDKYDNIVMQGHSHVNMSTFASPTDKEHQESILTQLRNNKFYIFLIWNKRLEHVTAIYDMENNIMYDDNEIEYGILDDECNLDDFIKEAQKMVAEHKYTKPTTTYSSGYYSGNYGSYYGNYNSDGSRKKEEKTSSKIKNKQKGKSGIGNGWQGRGSDDMDDEAYGYYGKDYNCT